MTTNNETLDLNQSASKQDTDSDVLTQNTLIPPETEEDIPSLTSEDSDDDASELDEGHPSSNLFSDLFEKAFSKSRDHNLDDTGLLEAYYTTVLSKPGEETESDKMEIPTRGDITAWILQQYRDAGMKYYPEEVKAQVRLILLAYYTLEDVDDPADDPVMVKLVKEVWST